MHAAEYLEYGGVLAAGVSLYQAQQYHSKEINKARERHTAAMELAKEQHRKDLLENKRNYLLEMFTNLEQHFQQLNADLIANSKEAERDMFDQRNQNFQALTLAASVMFGSLSTALVDGRLPSSTNSWLIVTFALSSALAFSFLFFSMVICIEVMIHASHFMYGRARMHNQQLRHAIRNTQIMMDSLYAKKENDDQDVDDEAERKMAPSPPPLAKTLSFSDLSSAKFNRGEKVQVRERRFITQLNDTDLDHLWFNHEKELEKYLRQREDINSKLSAQISNEKYTFQHFWQESCSNWAELSLLCFYFGTINLLITIVVYMWTYFLLDYHSLLAALISVILISLSLVVGIAAVIINRALRKSSQPWLIMEDFAPADNYSYSSRDSSFSGRSNSIQSNDRRYHNQRQQQQSQYDEEIGLGEFVPNPLIRRQGWNRPLLGDDPTTTNQWLFPL